MMEKVTVAKDMIIRLPNEVRKFVSEGDEFVVSIVGDSLRFKKVQKPDLLDLAAVRRDNDAPALEEISRIVHSLRGISEAEGSH
ncbi:MAG: hypothetical protein Q7T53_12035 [Deltaproteobacteria bacterium]|nr:hypothetical protein [Deltaproteobacteria bacterium]